MIKYRFWDDVGGRMLVVNTINFSTKTHQPISVKCIGVTLSLPVTTGVLMQYTGYNDKDGKEIYEGDTVLVQSKGLMGEVYFQNGVFFITGCEATGGVAEEDRQLLGNRHENPNLANGVFLTNGASI